MQKITFFIIFSAFLISCSKEDKGDTKEIPFVYNGEYSGKIQYPDGMTLYFTLEFNPNLTYTFNCNTSPVSSDNKKLSVIKGTYNYDKISNGVFNIFLSDTATIKYGYRDIVDSPIDVNNLGTIFPLDYTLTIIITNESYGQYRSVNLINTDYSQGYSIQATVWESWYN